MTGPLVARRCRTWVICKTPREWPPPEAIPCRKTEEPRFGGALFWAPMRRQPIRRGGCRYCRGLWTASASFAVSNPPQFKDALEIIARHDVELIAVDGVAAAHRSRPSIPMSSSGLTVHVLGLAALIRTKEEAGRDQDRAVLELLRQALRGSTGTERKYQSARDRTGRVISGPFFVWAAIWSRPAVPTEH